MFCSQFDTNLTPVPWTSSTLKITFILISCNTTSEIKNFDCGRCHSNIASREPASVLLSEFIVLTVAALPLGTLDA